MPGNIAAEWAGLLGEQDATALERAFVEGYVHHYDIVVRSVAEDPVAYAGRVGLPINPTVSGQSADERISVARQLVANAGAEPIASSFPGEFA